VIEPSQLALFALAAGVLVIVLGPDMLLVLGRALGQGRIAAFLAGALSDYLARRPQVVAGLNICAGMVFLLSGLKIATFEQAR
jgi:threonine/homoserine/homoserine lactone efflux protein